VKTVLVCGGRGYADAATVGSVLDDLNEVYGIKIVVHGAAPGADTLAKIWADTRRVAHWAFPADWKAHGKAAGPIRNKQMLDEAKPDLVVAFPGGRGTADMRSQAKTAGVEVLEIMQL
jgi:hypothetical protein